MLSGNKGEWSEVYVFFKLLGEGKLFGADEKLEKMSDIFYPIVKIIRQESKREYLPNGEISVVDGETGKVLLKVKKNEFLRAAKELFEHLKQSKGSSFSFPDIEEFLKSIDIYTLTPSRANKSDIKIVVHDLRTSLEHELGFSIKSMLGQKSTLFNPGNGTNFIFKVTGQKLDKDVLGLLNAIEETPKICNRIKRLKEMGNDIEFVDIASPTLKENLVLIDSSMPEILSYLLLYKYRDCNDSKIGSLVEKINQENPLGFTEGTKHRFYEHKIKRFLTDAALGLTPECVWNGEYDATGGIIIVKKNGEVVCYHIYNMNEFQDFLIKNTQLEQASTSRYDFGNFYEKDGEVFIKLNLQVRFSN